MSKKQIFIIFLVVATVAILTVVFASKNSSPNVPSSPQDAFLPSDVVTSVPDGSQSTDTGIVSKDFTDFDNNFKFKANIQNNWRIEHVEESQAINLYDPKSAGQTSLDQSQVFIKHFTATDFLTLPEVDILSRQSGTMAGKTTVLYEISKKSGQPDFPDQPQWRNQNHSVLDVRVTPANPSIFYVFAKNPALPAEDFLAFVQSVFYYDDQNELLPPIMDYRQRITKKPFGIQVSPGDSPVAPERFSGFHTGTDFEVATDELDVEIPVHSICYGEVVEKKQVAGYGGVIVQQCTLEGQPITVVYGHLSFDAEFARNVGKYLIAGDLLATLGDGQSAETDGERKHLHLGIHKGTEVDLRGYVNSQGELEKWIDFEKHVVADEK